MPTVVGDLEPSPHTPITQRLPPFSTMYLLGFILIFPWQKSPPLGFSSPEKVVLITLALPVLQVPSAG